MKGYCKLLSLSTSSQFYTTITYTVVTAENETVPKSCFNATFIQTANDLCGASHTYLAQVPLGGIPSFIDLQENDSAMDVDREEIGKLLTLALQKIGMTNPGRRTIWRKE